MTDSVPTVRAPHRHDPPQAEDELRLRLSHGRPVHTFPLWVELPRAFAFGRVPRLVYVTPLSRTPPPRMVTPSAGSTRGLALTPGPREASHAGAVCDAWARRLSWYITTVWIRRRRWQAARRRQDPEGTLQREQRIELRAGLALLRRVWLAAACGRDDLAGFALEAAARHFTLTLGAPSVTVAAHKVYQDEANTWQGQHSGARAQRRRIDWPAIERAIAGGATQAHVAREFGVTDRAVRLHYAKLKARQ